MFSSRASNEFSWAVEDILFLPFTVRSKEPMHHNERAHMPQVENLNAAK